MKNANEIIYRVAGASYISVIDLVKFFYQIELSPKCRHYTAFYTPFGTFHYNVLAQGLCGAPNVAQKLIDRVMRGSHRHCAGLMDDLIVYSTTWEKHLNHLRDVFERLQNAGLTANMSKCVFASESIKILGFWVRQGKICIDEEKLEAIKNWKLPKNKTQLKSFLGFVNFFDHFLPNHSELAAPLTDMLASKKSDKLVWGQNEINSFERLKTQLLGRPVLRPPDPNKPFKLFCDANAVSVAGLLMQYDEHAENHYIIACASKKLLPREKNYSTIECEVYAIVFSVSKFKQWIYGREVHVYTDHRALLWLNTIVKHNSRLARWALMLQEMDIRTNYIKGKKQIADALTRTPNMYE